MRLDEAAEGIGKTSQGLEGVPACATLARVIVDFATDR